MIGTAPRSNITGVPGWETEAEQAYLLQLARDVRSHGTIVEIGAEFGMSTSIFCRGALPNVKIVSVDLFPDDMLNSHLVNLAEAGYYGRTHQIQGDSKLAGKQWDQGEIDLLFVDGDHSYEGCKADIEGWIPHVAVGGVVAFHDVAQMSNLMPHELHFQVTRAVSGWYFETHGTWRQLRAIDSTLAFERLK
jgi:predicted O-methyltransferase YrrM